MAADNSDPHDPHAHAAAAFPVTDPLTDLSGDGIADSVMLERPDGGLALFTDLDGNGYADHITTVDHEGRAVAWQLSSGVDGEWHITDSGHL